MFLTLNYFTVPKKLPCDVLLVPAGKATGASTPCTIACGVGFGGGWGRLLGLGFSAHDCSDGDWDQWWQLRLLPGGGN